MVTGQKIIQKNNKNPDKGIVLSIQVSLSGLSFFVLDNDKNQVIDLIHTAFEKTHTPQELLDQLVHHFNTHKVLQQPFSKTTLIHDNEMVTLVPSALFEEEYLSDYLKYNTKIFKTDFITYDVIKNDDIMIVYVPFVNINNYIFERFGSFEYKHSTTVALDRILEIQKNNAKESMYINIAESYFDLVVTKNNALQLYNRFEYQTKDDFIYYVLFVSEQLGLNPEEFECVLMGAIKKDDELYSIAYKYIRHVSLLSKDKMLYSHNNSTKNFTILNSF
ncbi:MAG: DUF3822 family protein [Flavobacteriaceae bacterium]